MELPECNAPRIRREALDKTAESIVVNVLGDPDKMWRLVEDHAKRTMAQGDNSYRIEQIKKEIASFEADKERSKSMCKRRIIDEDELERDYKRLDAAIAESRRFLSALLPITSFVSPTAISQVLAPFDEWAEGVELTREEKRAILVSIGAQFVVRAMSNGGRGAGAKTEFVIEGVWLRVIVDSNLVELPPVNRSIKRPVESVSYLRHPPTAPINNTFPIYIPFNDLQMAYA
jgi:hypothetical protein